MLDPTTNQTRLSQSDLKAIDQRTHHEQQFIGESPTLELLKAQGFEERRWLHIAVETISNSGRILTLLVSEFISSVAVLVIVSVFGLLEYWRVVHGAVALGQSSEQANLIALAVVTANIVHPIYALRGLRGQAEYEVIRPTLRGWLESLCHRIISLPQREQVSWSHNPTLDLAALMITWTTIVLAVYDLIAPLVTSILTGTTSKPILILIAELIMGLGLSISGVFFLQSASHEIGVRALVDQPKSLTDELQKQQQAYRKKLEAIRERVTQEHIAGKLADAHRRQQAKGQLSADPLVVTGTVLKNNGNAPNVHENGHVK